MKDPPSRVPLDASPRALSTEPHLYFDPTCRPQNVLSPSRIPHNIGMYRIASPFSIIPYTHYRIPAEMPILAHSSSLITLLSLATSVDCILHPISISSKSDIIGHFSPFWGQSIPLVFPISYMSLRVSCDPYIPIYLR